MLVALAALAGVAHGDSLEDGFKDPPQTARPRVWWHWLNGNVTKDGIAKDLAWMKSTGLGGLQNFDASLGTPQIVERRLAYMTPEWQDAFRYAVDLADRTGLEFTIAASPGWSETGGPWVTPADGMKKLVWSETTVRGGKTLRMKLPAPPVVTGPFQGVEMSDPLAMPLSQASTSARPSYYADAAVLAYPVPVGATIVAPRVTDGAEHVYPADALLDSDLASSVAIDPGSPTAPPSLVLSYAAPTLIRSCTFYIPHAVPPFGQPVFVPTLEVREGGGWRELASLTLTEVPTTVSFAPVTAREFRVVLHPNTAVPRGVGEPAPGAVQFSIFAADPPGAKVRIAELRLSGEAKVHQFEAKAGYAVARDYYALNASVDSQAQGIDPARIIDLSSRMQADGSFEWTAPAGQWRILRLGYSLTGKTNHPAAPEATGLEVDKYDGAAVRRYLEKYLASYRDAVGGENMGARGVRALLTDSIEVGPANWTSRLIEQFQRLRGYDPKPWLPALAGAVVGSRERSDAFLYDFRRTLAELLTTEHYATVAAVAHEHGLIVYGEALENGRPTLGDDMAMRSYADVPMAALWAYGRDGAAATTLLGDMKGAASVAHIYGKQFVAAESLTSMFAPWAHAPADLRPVIDLEFAYGINRPVLHTSVHQPSDDKVPGLSLAIFGQYFNRHETWAGMARPWIDYIARTGFLLQQGRNAADVAYFYGEEQPLTALFVNAPLADTPSRHTYDFVNSDALLNRLVIQDGSLVSDGGARYRVLYLGAASAQMTLPVLRRCAELVEAGATLVGTAPHASPSLADDVLQFKALVQRLWPGSAVTSLGKGRVIASRDVDAALASIGLKPAFDYDKAAGSNELLYAQRTLADGDVFFAVSYTHLTLPTNREV